MTWPAPGEGVTHLRFDGVWRPEPWGPGEQWAAISYRSVEGRFKRVRDESLCAERLYKSEEAAQARCDELNATRTGVSQPREPQRSML